MDLGATVCRPVPRCGDCPVAVRCSWRAAGLAAPDPADGSAAVSTRQAPYEGSDRQARGAVLRALHDGPRRAEAFPAPIVDGLVADRLVTRTGDHLHLP
jgi:A/G-specific adenine glycosylase